MPVMIWKEEGSPDDQENARKANDNWRRDIDDCQMSAGLNWWGGWDFNPRPTD